MSIDLDAPRQHLAGHRKSNAAVDSISHHQSRRQTKRFRIFKKKIKTLPTNPSRLGRTTAKRLPFQTFEPKSTIDLCRPTQNS